jgi:tRNA threonylcarbamoyladenosine biosynthesis protein TsaB
MLLALDTSTRLGSLAIGDDSGLIGECTLSVRATHSETVLPEAVRLFARAGRRVEELTAVVVGAGPGSFTGVRIAASLAKGLCFARDIPLLAFSSLAAVAASSGGKRVCAAFDARRGEVYAAAYDFGKLPRAEWGPAVLSIDDVLKELTAPDWWFAGDGAVRNAIEIEAAGGRVLPMHIGVPRASALLWLAHRAPEEGRVKDPALWQPGSVRASGAERRAGAPESVPLRGQ